MWIAPSTNDMTTLVTLMRPETTVRASSYAAAAASAALNLSTRNEAHRRYRSDLSAWAELAKDLDQELRGESPSDTAPLARSSGSVALGGSTSRNASTVLADLPETPLSSSGSLQLNGVDILVASGSDTVDSLISHINSSGSGVTASLNRSGELELSSENSFQIAGDSSLLAGLGFKTSRVSPAPDQTFVERLNSSPVQAKLQRLGEGLDSLLNPYRQGGLDALDHSQSLARIALRLRDGIRDNLSPSFDPLKEPSYDTGFGLSFGFRGDSLWQWQPSRFNQLEASSQTRFGQLLSQGLGPQGWSLLRGVRAAVLSEAERFGGAEALA